LGGEVSPGHEERSYKKKEDQKDKENRFPRTTEVSEMTRSVPTWKMDCWKNGNRTIVLSR
jgi:hypothetical protein